MSSVATTMPKTSKAPFKLRYDLMNWVARDLLQTPPPPVADYTFRGDPSRLAHWHADYKIKLVADKERYGCCQFGYVVEQGDRRFNVQVEGFIMRYDSRSRSMISVSSHTNASQQTEVAIFDGEPCVLENCPCGGRETNHKTYNKLKNAQIRETKAIMQTIFPVLTDLRFSAKAGCSCPCSPGFVSGALWRGISLSVTITEVGFEPKRKEAVA